MSFFSSPMYGTDFPSDENDVETNETGCEDDDILNDETFGAAEIVDWETEHKRLTELDVDGFEEFGCDITHDDGNGHFRPNGQAREVGAGFSLSQLKRNEFDDLGREPSDEFGVDVEQDLQRLVLEVDRDDRIESAWMTADPAIKMLSKKIPNKQADSHVTGAVGGDVLGTSPIFEPPQPPSIMPGMDEQLGKIWATSPAVQTPVRPGHLGGPPAGGKMVSELEGELGVVDSGGLSEELPRAQPSLQPQHHLPQSRMGNALDGSVSPLAHQMFLNQLQIQQQQQQLTAAAALLQQQQQQQQQQPSRMLLAHPNASSMGLMQNPRQLQFLRQMTAAQHLLQQQQQLASVSQQNQLMQLQQQQQLIQQQQQQQQQQKQQHHHQLQQQQYQHPTERRWHGGAEGSSNGFNRQRRYSEHLGPDRLGNSDDPYAGLMTRSEKEWLISIHHRQLEVDNPFVQDYYYTQLKLKKDLEARETAIASGQLPLPPDPLLLLRSPVEVPDEFDDSMPVHSSAPYIPSQFANTLGKLTTASVHNPRQVIDAQVHRDSVELDDEATAGLGSTTVGAAGEGARISQTAQDRYRRLLLTIENCYSLLLRIQEYDISIAKILVSNAPSRHILINDRHRLKQQLLGIVLASEASVTDFFRARKGALLFANVLSKVDSKYVDLCLRSLFTCYHRIRQLQKSVGVLEEVGPEFLRKVSASLCSQEGTVWHRGLLFFIWMHTNHAEILSDRLGLSLVLQIMKQFASSITDQEELKHFQKHVEQFAMNVFVLPPERRVRPYRSYADLLGFIRKHMESTMLNNFADCLTFSMTGPIEESESDVTDTTTAAGTTSVGSERGDAESSETRDVLLKSSSSLS